MSHEIEIDEATGLAAFVAARETAWHQLGDFEADRLLTVSEAIERAKLAGWEVRGVPSGAMLKPGLDGWVSVPKRHYPARVSPFNGELEVLGNQTVGQGFAFFQNENLGQFAEEVAGLFGDEQVVSAAGSMMRGTRVFITLALEGFTVLGEDAHDQWLTVMNGHDGRMNLTGFTGAVRVVCKNTADWALKGTTNRVQIRHSGDMIAKATEAAKILTVARDWATEYNKLAEELAAQKMTDLTFAKMIRANFVPKPAEDASPQMKARRDADFEAIVANFKTSPTTEVGRGTKWAALNAITEWAEWGRRGDLLTEKAATANLFGKGPTSPAVLRAKAVKVLTR
jgi:phage/plasmid-like protein (TIGR03299 family)